MENMLWKNEIRQRKTSSRTLQRLYEIKILLGKREKNMLGQGLYKLKRGF